MICITAGSDLALRSCFELFTNAKDNIITINPTFGMVNVYAKLFNLKNISIGYDKNLNLNVQKLYKSINKKISLIVLANPNSPTGTEIKHSEMIKILEKTNKFKIPLIIDEAYYGFHKSTYLDYTKKFSNLIVTRSFSKVFGLAGLRTGFLATNKKNAQKLYNLKPMYEINSLSCLAIKFLLKNSQLIRNHVNLVNQGREFLISVLKDLNVNYLKSNTNFFHIDIGKKKKIFEKKLYKNKILVRKGPGVAGYENYLRVSLGSIPQMKKITKLLKETL